MNRENETPARESELLKKATNPKHYDSSEINWREIGSVDSPSRQFFSSYLKKALGDLTGKTVLDIGSGTGQLSELLKELGAEQITGIEPSSKSVAISKEKYPDVTVFEGTLAEANFSLEFDVGIIVMVFEHIENLGGAFRKISSLIKPGGMFFTIVADKTTFTTPRHDYEITAEELNGEAAVLRTRRPSGYGTTYDIVRPIEHFVETAQTNGFQLERHTPMLPTEELIQQAPKYKLFKDRPLTHLLVFNRLEK